MQIKLSKISFHIYNQISESENHMKMMYQNTQAWSPSVLELCRHPLPLG